MTSAFERRIRATSRLRWPVAAAGLCLVLWGYPAAGLSAAELERIVEILDLREGSIVADVGAGDGEWTVALARQVGDRGRVWATEVDRTDTAAIEQRVRDASLDNVTVALGSQADTGLPEGCCDAILLRMVYHHFVEPVKMRASLRRALRPGGLIAVIDIMPQASWRDLPDVPDRGGHGVSLEELLREMTSDGFEVVMHETEWNGDIDRYCVVFRR